MNFGQAIIAFWNRSFDFMGRSRRSEYWFAYLFCSIISIILSITDGIYYWSIYYDWVYVLYSLIFFIPSLSISVRRLHDVNKSWWKWVFLPFFLASLVIFISFTINSNTLYALASIALFFIFGWSIFLIVLFCLPGTQGPNKYGPDPKPNNDRTNIEGMQRSSQTIPNNSNFKVTIKDKNSPDTDDMMRK